MSAGFDRYRTSYGDEVQGSIDFSGLKHDFFLSAKADMLERIIEDRGLRRDGRSVEALDVGCGVGALHPHLAGIFDRLEGCDISAESIARAQLENPGNIYAAYTPPRLPYSDGSFDLAMASCVMHHVPPADWPVFATEMRRVLRPGGIVVIIEHNPWNPLTRLAVFRCPFDEDAVLLRAGKTATLLGQAGFTEARSEHFLLLPSENRAARAVERAFSGMPLGPSMPAAQGPESARAGLVARKLSWFAAVGLAATALYAILALLFDRLGWSPVAASIFAYGMAAVFSYVGHKFLTFVSPGSHAQELPRFLVSTALGLSVATVLPIVLSGYLDLPALVPVIATCMIVPIVNFLLLDRFVFTAART